MKPAPPPGSPNDFRGVARIGGPGTDDPTRIRFRNFSLRAMVSEAWGKPYYAVAGPDWTEELRYEAAATLPRETSEANYRIMLQNLLAERFQLAIRKEQKVMSQYALTVAKNGPKLSSTPSAKLPEGAPILQPGQTSYGMRSYNGHTQGLLQAYNESLELLVKMLSGQRPRL